jgi:hypothetical protein
MLILPVLLNPTGNNTLYFLRVGGEYSLYIDSKYNPLLNNPGMNEKTAL